MIQSERIQAVRKRLQEMKSDEDLAEASGAPCIACKHYEGPLKGKPAYCRHLVHTERTFNPVTGEYHEKGYTPALTARSEGGLCGPEGVLFDPKSQLPEALIVATAKTLKIALWGLVISASGAVVLAGLLG